MNGLAYEELELQALSLPEQQRSALATRLIGSLEEGDRLSPEWEAELDRRVRDLDSGAKQAIPASEVHAEMKRRFGV